MKTKNIFKPIGLFFIILCSCINNEDFSIPTLGEDKEYVNFKSLSDIANLHQGNLVTFEEETTTSGYVISSDKDGNFYKSIFIQDTPTDPTIGVEIKINDTNLSARYAIGRKIFINLKGLFLNKTHGNYQIGSKNTFGNGIERISVNDYVYFIDRSSEISDVTPTLLDISELNEKHTNTLIKVNNVQSEIKGLQYATPNSSSEYVINRSIISCNTSEKLILTNSVFTSFKSLFIPDKKGSITGVFNMLDDKKYLTIRNTNDIDFNEEYGCFNNPTEASLADIKSLFTGVETKINQNSKIKVVVTSDLSEKNITNKEAFAQDKTAGISLFFSDIHNLNLGDEIEIAVGGLNLTENNGVLQLNLTSSNIINKTTGSLPVPELITIEQALSGNYESKLVKIENVQFKDLTKNYASENTLTSNCTNELKIIPAKTDASFANNLVSDKKGVITGVMTNFNGVQIHIRNKTDINFTETYTCTSVGDGSESSTDLYFSEYAEGSSNNKYIEIYNGTGTTINLANYKLQLYRNGSSVATKELELNTLTNTYLTNGEVIVIYNSSANSHIKNEGDLSSSLAIFNGDDAISLIKNDVIIDVIGTIGEDPGFGWKVADTDNATKDHTLIRKTIITKGTKDWYKSAGTNASNSEWEVKDKDDFSSVGKK
ncbi:hypothetical protein CXF68_02840 [Tenacibaculum sp. Bg11-29]|uniref:DUF5689 domain-containing protein n=1 Tax=Tenacibaculum sp. Bg11-29 TaxID=2058306 RepID=UPI000C349B7E|nr:DUF5689 domain-containing protein [Tenacibaculum sp. Bg11-29]PKH49695.1 hypothetical protein CXF68_02840 [Tenacibaculum sp. Bg11-29]